MRPDETHTLTVTNTHRLTNKERERDRETLSQPVQLPEMCRFVLKSSSPLKIQKLFIIVLTIIIVLNVTPLKSAHHVSPGESDKSLRIRQKEAVGK